MLRLALLACLPLLQPLLQTQEQAPIVLGRESILARLAAIGREAAPLGYTARVELVDLDPRDQQVASIVRRLELPLEELPQTEVERAVQDLLEQAREVQPASFRGYSCRVTWSDWRQVVRYLPGRTGDLLQEDFVQTATHHARFQPASGQLRFGRGATRSESALLSELVPTSVPTEEQRSELVGRLAWTERSLEDGRRLTRLIGSSPGTRWLWKPGALEESRPLARREGATTLLFSHDVETGRLSRVIALENGAGKLQVRHVELKEHVLDPPARDQVLEIGIPSRILIPSREEGATIDSLPEEWRGLVVVRSR